MKNPFLHLLLVFLLVAASLYGFFYLYLPAATKHGESIPVPDLRGKNLSDIKDLLAEKGLQYEVFDSTYLVDARPLTVINQLPKAGTYVKSQRKIYLSVTSIKPPQVKMPQLVTFSFKTAEMLLKSYGLKLGQVTYQPNVNENVVLKQLYNNQDVLSGTYVPKGSVISLVVSRGLGDQTTPVPSLVGLTLSEAEIKLASFGLELGSVVYDETSELLPGFIFKQKPEYLEGDSSTFIRAGEVMDIWVSGSHPEKQKTE